MEKKGALIAGLALFVMPFASNAFAQNDEGDDQPSVEVVEEENDKAKAEEGKPAEKTGKEDLQEEKKGKKKEYLNEEEEEEKAGKAQKAEEETAEKEEEDAEETEEEKAPPSKKEIAQTYPSSSNQFGLGMLFGGYSSEYGDMSGLKLAFSMSHYYSLMKGSLRLGPTGFLFVGGETDNKDISAVNFYNARSTTSTSRSIGGLLIGADGAYMIKVGKGIYIPVGLLLGLGAGSYSSTLGEDDTNNNYLMHQDEGLFIALKPSAGVEFSLSEKYLLSFNLSYLFADPFGDTKQLGGFGVMVGFGVQ